MRYFTRDEVVVHNLQHDIWMIIGRCVFDVTTLFEAKEISDNLKLLLAHAGKDLSHFFEKDGSPLYRVDESGRSLPVFLPVLLGDWWCNDSKIVGYVTVRERRVKIINTLIRKTTSLTVCEEDSIAKIQERLKCMYGYSTDKFIWRKKCTLDNGPNSDLRMDETLTQNGILYEENEKLGMPSSLWIFHNI